MENFENLWSSFCLGMVIGCLIVLILFAPNSNIIIESKELIKPQIKLEINNNKVDTVFVYHRVNR